MAEIDNLSLAISAEASSATAALDKLITKLNALSNTMASISVSNLSDLAYDMQSLGNAMNYLKSQDFTKLSKSLNALASVNAAQIETLSAGLQSLSNGVLGLGSVTFDATSLTNLATSLSKLGGVKASSATTNLGTLKNDLAQFINGMNSISGLTFDVSSLSNLVSTLSKLGNSSATQAVANLPTLSAQLQNFVRQLNGIGALSFDTGNLTELVSSISLLGRRGASQAATSIPQLTTALMNLMTTLSSAPTVNQNVISMTNALANLASTGASTGTAAKSVSSALTNYSSTASTASKSSFSLASAIGKVYASYWILLRAVSKVKDAIEYASDLTEAQNVVTGTFAQYENVMNDFADTSIQNYGMSELTAKTIGSRFQAMGVAAGYARDEMAEMSVTLTGLAGDMASFYNKDAEDVATALNSVFTGETEPLRKYGVDLTNATIEQWALTQGMEVSMSTMTNYEKIMLRYQYTLAHTTDAQGDFLRTQNSWANQTTVLSEQLKQLASIIGETLIYALKSCVVQLNSMVSDMISFAESVENSLGKIFGWEIDTSIKKATDDYSTSVSSVSDSLGDAADNAKKYKLQLQSFDEINNLTTSDTDGTDSGSDSGTGTSGTGIDEAESYWKKTDSLFESALDDLYKLGNYISTTLTDSLKSINWEDAYQDARDFGTGLADFLNGLITPDLFYELGSTVASSLNTALYAALAFGDELNWVQMADSIAAGVNGFFDDFDFVAFADTLDTWIQNLTFSLVRAAKEIEWGDVFEGIGEFFENIDIETVAIVAGALLWEHAGKELTSSALSGLFTTSLNGKTISASTTLAIAATVAAISFNLGTQWYNSSEPIQKFSDMIGEWVFGEDYTEVNVPHALTVVFGGLVVSFGTAAIAGALMNGVKKALGLGGAGTAAKASKGIVSSLFSGISTAVSGLGGWGSIFTTDMGTLFGASTSFAEVGTLIGTTLGAAVIAAVGGYFGGNWLGKLMFPDDADVYDQFDSIFDLFGEGGLFDSLAWDVMENNCGALGEAIQDLGGFVYDLYLKMMGLDEIKGIFDDLVRSMDDAEDAAQEDYIKSFFTDEQAAEFTLALENGSMTAEDVDELYKSFKRLESGLKLGTTSQAEYDRAVQAAADAIAAENEMIENQSVLISPAPETISSVTDKVEDFTDTVEDSGGKVASVIEFTKENGDNLTRAISENAASSKNVLADAVTVIGGDLTELAADAKATFGSVRNETTSGLAAINSSYDIFAQKTGSAWTSASVTSQVNSDIMQNAIKPVGTSASDAASLIKSSLASADGVATEKASSIANTFGTLSQSIKDALSGTSISEAFQTFTNNLSSLSSGISGASTELSNILKAKSTAKNVASSNTSSVVAKILGFASGGYPDQYSLFMAGEGGVPEMLGTVGGKTAVAGGSEITGIRDAVSSASAQEVALMRQQNQLLQAILEKETGISVSTIGKAARSYAQDYYRRTGKSAYGF